MCCAEVRRFVLVAVAMLAARAATAATGPGTAGAASLVLPQGVRPEGMGGAFVGVADDVSALFWNPGGLGRVQERELSVMHASYLAGSTYQVLGWTQPVAGLGTIAAAASLLEYGKIERTVRGDNGMYGGTAGTVSAEDAFLTVGWGRPCPAFLGLQGVSVGASLKLVYQQLDGGSQTGVGVAGGLLWNLPVPGVRAGLLADNLGATVNGSAILPMNWRVGASWAAGLGPDWRVLCAADTRLGLDARPRADAGIEVEAYRTLALRAGWRTGDSAGPTAGAGVRLPKSWLGGRVRFKLDYAAGMMGELGLTQRLQLGIVFGGGGRSLTRPGHMKLRREGGAQYLTWEGDAPAYKVFISPTLPGVFKSITPEPVTEPKVAMTDVPAGVYHVIVRALDPGNPGCPPVNSRPAKLRLSPPPSATVSGDK